MSNPFRSRNTLRRASFGRTERLKRQAVEGRTAKDAPARDQAREVRSVHTRERDRTPAIARSKAQGRKLTAVETVQQRIERARAATERQRQQRLKEQTRTTFAQQAERRRDTARRAEQERTRQHVQATRKRAEDNRRRHVQQLVERKRDEMRRAFNREAERRCDAGRRVKQDRIRQRAAVEIGQRHKRQLADQQAEHRRQTSELRTRHQAETRSLRGNENAALERHHHAVRNIDEREGCALDDFDTRRSSLTGRLAERIPGRRAENDQKRADLRKGFEAERLIKHRDLEALKERQFEVAQKARQQQAKERKASMDGHRTDRTQLADRQKGDRPRLIEGQARALVRAERERSREVEQVRKEPEREMARPAPAFGRT